MDPAVWIALIGLFIAGGLTPGPAVMLVMSSALRHGWAPAMLPAFGVTLANLGWVALADLQTSPPPRAGAARLAPTPGRRAAGTAVGVIDGFVYLGTGLQAFALGKLNSISWSYWAPFLLVGNWQ